MIGNRLVTGFVAATAQIAAETIWGGSHYLNLRLYLGLSGGHLGIDLEVGLHQFRTRLGFAVFTLPAGFGICNNLNDQLFIFDDDINLALGNFFLQAFHQ